MPDLIVPIDPEEPEAQPARIGRHPVELTKLEKERLTAMAAIGLNQELAAARLGVTAKTLRAIFKRDEEAKHLWTLGRAEAAEKALTNLWKMAMKGNPAAAIFLGKTLAGLRETGPFDGMSPSDRPPIAIAFQVVTGGQGGELKSVHPSGQWTSGGEPDDFDEEDEP